MPIQNWTTAAHQDYFERNILTIHGVGIESAVARAYNEFVSNAATVTWPTIQEVEAFILSPSYQAVVGGDTVDIELLQLALDTAVSRIAQRTGNYVRPVDADGAVDPDGTPVQILPEIKLATIIQAAEWYDAPLGKGGEMADVVLALIGNERHFGLA